MESSKNPVYRLMMGLLLVLLVVGGLAALMSSLRSARLSTLKSSLKEASRSMGDVWQSERQAQPGVAKGAERPPPPVRAEIKSFDAQIELTPRLSVGTASPESIYEAALEVDLEARNPAEGKQPCRIVLPLPPRIISLADLSVTVDGEVSEDVAHQDGHVVWQGELDPQATAKIHVAYKAVGKGIFRLEKPPGRIIDRFRARLVAHSGDIRMVALSLQPNAKEQKRGQTIYTWEYDRLLVAEPIQLDVLGIAAVDRLGDLGWLGPLSVLVFGVLISLVALAAKPEALTVWMLILMVGCFAAAYPLMYFLQEFVLLEVAMGGAAAAVLLVILIRCWSLFGFRLAVLGGLVLPGAVMALTIAATLYTRPAMQGVLLTAMGLLTLGVTMAFLPRVQRKILAARPRPRTPPQQSPPTPPQAPPGT